MARLLTEDEAIDAVLELAIDNADLKATVKETTGRRTRSLRDPRTGQVYVIIADGDEDISKMTLEDFRKN